MTRRDRIGGGLILGALLVGYWLMQAVGDGSPQSIDPQQGKQPSTAPAARQVSAINARFFNKTPGELVDPGPLPPSLAGAEPEVRLEADDNGQLIPTHDLVVLFDFYLAGLADEPLDTVLARIHLALSARLDGVALDDARDLLRRYVDYRVALMDLGGFAANASSPAGFSVGTLQQRLQGLESLRESLFTNAENSAFFELERIQDEYTVGRLAIEQDPSLDQAQRQQAIAELEHQLPDEIRALRQRVTRDAELYATTESMREQGVDAQAIYRVRAETLGGEAAAKLARLDRQRDQWRQRLGAYAEERNRIRQSGLSPEDQRMAIEDILERNFSALEQKRVRALDSEL